MACWWSFSFSILAFLSCALGNPPKAEVPAEVPQALQYLGRGYNIITGDPHSVNDRDPGWKGPILEPTSLKDEWISDDGRCNYDAYTHEITGGKSAQESMMSEWDVKASVGLWKIIKASFTASSSFQTMNSQSFKQKQTFFDTKAACHLKTAELPGAPETIYFKYNFSEAFRNAVKSIPTDGANASVQWVMEHMLSDAFGTHFTAKIASGASMGKRSWMSDSSKEVLEKTAKEKGFSLDLAAKGFFWIFSDPQNTDHHQENADATKAFQEATQSGETHTFCIGCDEFLSGDAEKWGEQVKDNLEPIGSKSNLLVPISELLVPFQFPEIDAQELKKKKTAVEQALEELCTFYAKEGCTTSPQDRIEFPERSIPTGSKVWSVQWSPNGTTFISGQDGLVRLWEATSGRSLRIFTGHQPWAAYSVAYSPNGSHIVSGSLDNSSKIWDAATGVCLQTLTGHTDAVESVAYSPNGSHIVSGSWDNSLKIWDAATGDCLRTLTGHTDAVESVAYSPNGSHIVSGSTDNSLKIWDASTGVCLQTLTDHTAEVSSVAYSPDGSHIVSGSLDNSLKIWDAATGVCLQTLTDHTDAVESVAYSPPNGSHIVSGSWDNSLKIWDASSGECLRTLTGHTDWVNSVAYSPDGSHIVSGSLDKSVKIWDASSGLAAFHVSNSSFHPNRKEHIFI